MNSGRGDIAHLGHVELLTPDLDGTVWFCTEILGLTETRRDGDSVHLRTYDDYELTSLMVTAHTTSGVRRTALRASGTDALERRAAAIRESGRDGAWVDGEAGTGRTFRTTDPDGHILDLYYETEWYRAPAEFRPALKNQPQAKPNRGVGVRRLDHVNFLAADVPDNAEFTEHLLGARPTEQIELDSGRVARHRVDAADLAISGSADPRAAYAAPREGTVIVCRAAEEGRPRSAQRHDPRPATTPRGHVMP